METVALLRAPHAAPSLCSQTPLKRSLFRNEDDNEGRGLQCSWHATRWLLFPSRRGGSFTWPGPHACLLAAHEEIGLLQHLSCAVAWRDGFYRLYGRDHKAQRRPRRREGIDRELENSRTRELCRTIVSGAICPSGSHVGKLNVPT